MRIDATAEQVQAAYVEIAAVGFRPTIEAVRDYLGNTHIRNAMQRFLTDWPENRQQVSQSTNVLPAELVNTFRKEMRRRAEASTSDL